MKPAVPEAGDGPSRAPAPPMSPVESVDRALLLLDFMRGQGSVSVKDAAGHLGVAPSTAHRLLNALSFRGYARQDHLRRYRIGPVFSTESAQSPALARIRDAARPALVDVHQQIAETVQLMVLRGGNIVFVDGIESDASLRVVMRLRDALPAFTSAGGKALLARLSNHELEEVYRKGVPQWPTAKIQSLAALKRSMTRIRQQGYATNFEETEQGVVGVGVAIIGPDGDAVAAMTTASPSIRFKRADLPVHVEVLQAAAATVGARLAVLDE